MNNKYFNNVNTLEELRKQYKELLKQYHPDNGGDVAVMQEVNTEYDKLFKILKYHHDNAQQDSTNNTESEYSKNMYDCENDKALRDVLNQIINFNGIDIEIIGQWVWVSGNTYACKKELKEIGFKWASQKKMWYWHSESFRKKSKKTLSMDAIRNYYGSTKVNINSKILLEA